MSQRGRGSQNQGVFRQAAGNMSQFNNNNNNFNAGYNQNNQGFNPMYNNNMNQGGTGQQWQQPQGRNQQPRKQWPRPSNMSRSQAVPASMPDALPTDTGHIAKECTKSSCKTCSQRHNTLLHIEGNNMHYIKPQEQNNQKHVDVNTVYTKNEETITLLPTALVMIKGKDQGFHTCRIMLDTGAQVSLISEACTQRFN